MNGMMAMLPLMPVTKGTPAEKGDMMPLMASAGEGEAKGKEGFLDVLAALLAGEEEEVPELMNVLKAKEGKEGLLLAELVQGLAEDEEGLLTLLKAGSLEGLASELKDAMEDMTLVLEDILLEDSFLSEEMLLHDSISDLLDELPEEWKAELEALFSEQHSLEGILEEFKHSGDPVQLIALLSAMLAKEEEGNLSEKSAEQGILALQQIITAYFPAMKQQGQPQSFKKLAADLKEFHSFAREHNNSSAFTQSRPEGQVLNTSRFAELAYLNQLAVQNGKTASPAPQQQSLFLDTANSQMARFHQLTMLQGEGQPERPSQDQFVRQFQNLLSRSTFQQLGNGVQQLSVKLHPANLGRLDINIQQVNGVMMATLMTTTKAARDLLEGQLAQLRQAFQSQNIQMDKIDVTQQQNQQLLKEQYDGRGKEQRHEAGNQEQQSGEEDEEVLDFSDFLEETINETV